MVGKRGRADYRNGSALKICEEQCREILRETELYLLKKVEKKLKK
jgi:hypothetical protein